MSSRRRFLVGAGGALGWATLGCSGLGQGNLGLLDGDAPVLDLDARDRRPTTGRVSKLPDHFRRLRQEQDGLERESLLFEPPGAKGRRPLLIGLHGNEGDSAWMYRHCTLGRLVHEAEWFGLFPECDVWSRSDPKPDHGDSRYLSAVLDRVLREFPIDRDHVYVTGFSGGGMRAYRMAALCSDRVRAIAVCGATVGHKNPGMDQWRPDKSGARPVSILHVHGKRDDTVDRRGGELDGRPGVDRVAMMEGLTAWAEHVGAKEVPGAKPPVGCPSRVSTRRWEAGKVVIQGVLDPQLAHSWAPYMNDALRVFFAEVA